MSAAAEVVIKWILYISASFPSDAVLLDFCNEHAELRKMDYVEVIGHYQESPSSYMVFFRLAEDEEYDIDDTEVAARMIVHLDNDKWIFRHQRDLDTIWKELKVKE